MERDEVMEKEGMEEEGGGGEVGSLHFAEVRAAGDMR